MKAVKVHTKAVAVEDVVMLYTGFLSEQAAYDRICSGLKRPNDWYTQKIGDLWYVLPYGVGAVEGL